MKIKKNKIYRLNEQISFRECSLANNYPAFDTGDCTNAEYIDTFGEHVLHCKQYGIHLHCTVHPNIELNEVNGPNGTLLQCPNCKEDIIVESVGQVIQECKKVLNREKFEDATLIRLDDWYTKEIREKIPLEESDYWIKVDIKTDKDKDTIIVLYVGNKNTKEKAQLFIKPEKLQLTSDHKDLDPASIIAKVEVTLKDRTLTHKYDEDNDKKNK